MKLLFTLLHLFVIFQIVFNMNNSHKVLQLQTGVSQGSKLISLAASTSSQIVSSVALTPQQLISVLPDEIGILYENWPMWSPGYLYYVKMQKDGNFVIYSTAAMNGTAQDNAVWTSNTGGSGVSPRRLVMRNDGALALKDSNNIQLWVSNTIGQGIGPFRVTMQDDGNLVFYDSTNKALWASGSNGKKF